MNAKSNVVIKGTQAGLTFHLNDLCAYDEVLRELEEKLVEIARPNEVHEISVHVDVGYRYVSEEQRAEIEALIRKNKNLFVESIDSQVVTRAAAQQFLEEREVVPIARMIRSGQVVHLPGDVLLIGDVNPGGTVIAGGNIYILGTLNGNVHAGYDGDAAAVVTATVFEPLQIKIGHYVYSDFHKEGEAAREMMSCAYVDHMGRVVIDSLQALARVRPDLASTKGDV